jgi:hypothetical protein
VGLEGSLILHSKRWSMESNKTAVQWLMDRLPSLFVDDSGHYKKLFEQALEMQKEQIIEAFKHGELPPLFVNYNAEQYYNETFGCNIDVIKSIK